MYICLYVCMQYMYMVHIYICTYVYMYVCGTYMYLYMSLCIYANMDICVYMDVYTGVGVCCCVCI